MNQICVTIKQRVGFGPLLPLTQINQTWLRNSVNLFQTLCNTMCFPCKVISQQNCPVYSDYRDRIHFSLHVCCIWRKICKQSEDQELILFVSCLLQPLSMVVSVNQRLWEDGTSMQSACRACVRVCEREGEREFHIDVWAFMWRKNCPYLLCEWQRRYVSVISSSFFYHSCTNTTSHAIRSA